MSRTWALNRFSTRQDNFALLMRCLGSGIETQCNHAQYIISKWHPAHVVSQLIELWPQVMRKRRRQAQEAEWLLKYVLPVYGCFGFAQISLAWLQVKEVDLITIPTTILASMFGYMLLAHGIHTMSQVKGMVSVLLQQDDPRLTGFLVDALTLDRAASDGIEENRRRRIIEKLTRLLPGLSGYEMIGLDGYQRGVLVKELQRYAKRMRRGKAITDEEADFVVAVLSVLSAGRDENARAARRTATAVRELANAPHVAEACETHQYVQAVAAQILRQRGTA